MTSNRKTDDPLTLLLRQGDPAAESEDLSAAAVARMRNALVIALAARDRSPQLRWWPVLATAAAAVLLLVLVLDRRSTEQPLIDSGQEKPAPVTVAEKIAIPEAAARPSAATEVVAEPRLATPKPTERRVMHSVPNRQSQSRPVRVAAKQAAEPAGVAKARTARQIEFETPGGTRVVWVLDPTYQALSTEVDGR